MGACWRLPATKAAPAASTIATATPATTAIGTTDITVVVRVLIWVAVVYPFDVINIKAIFFGVVISLELTATATGIVAIKAGSDV